MFYKPNKIVCILLFCEIRNAWISQCSICVDKSDFVGRARTSCFWDQNMYCFRDRHFCLYFGSGCQLSPSQAQAQNTGKNDDLKNGPGKLFKINSRINNLHILVTKTWSSGSANKVWLIYTLGPLWYVYLSYTHLYFL